MANPNCNTNFCSPQQLAQQDIFDWSAMLFPLLGDPKFVPVLPSSDTVDAQGTITPVGNGYFELRTTWVERIGNTDTVQQMALEFAL